MYLTHKPQLIYLQHIYAAKNGKFYDFLSQYVSFGDLLGKRDHFPNNLAYKSYVLSS